MKRPTFLGIPVSLQSLGIKRKLPNMKTYGVFLDGKGIMHVEDLDGTVYQCAQSVTLGHILNSRSPEEANRKIRTALETASPTGLSYIEDFLLPGNVSIPHWPQMEAQGVGVTYQRSVDFRNEELAAGEGRKAKAKKSSAPLTHYDKAGDTNNAPEVFDKAGDGLHRYHGHGGVIILPKDTPQLRISADDANAGKDNKMGASCETELTFILAPCSRLETPAVVGVMLGNDFTFNFKESANVLYLHQAKVGDTMCGLSAMIRILPDDATDVDMSTKIIIQVWRDGKCVFKDYQVREQMKRTTSNLAHTATYGKTMPAASALLTGTGINPFPVVDEDIVVIGMDGVGYVVARVKWDKDGPDSQFNEPYDAAHGFSSKG